MSVEAHMKQYSGLRAIGMSDTQLEKMIVVETVCYAVTGGLLGTILGLFLNKMLYEFLVILVRFDCSCVGQKKCTLHQQARELCPHLYLRHCVPIGYQ